MRTELDEGQVHLAVRPAGSWNVREVRLDLLGVRGVIVLLEVEFGTAAYLWCTGLREAGLRVWWARQPQFGIAPDGFPGDLVAVRDLRGIARSWEHSAQPTATGLAEVRLRGPGSDERGSAMLLLDRPWVAHVFENQASVLQSPEGELIRHAGHQEYSTMRELDPGLFAEEMLDLAMLKDVAGGNF